MEKPNAIPIITALLLFAAAAHAGETPETILIRRTLGNDLSGHRRADTELVLSAYHQDFVAYQGNANADPRAWSILHEDLAAFTQALEKDLAAYRFETERTLPFIHVRSTKAMITSIDSGQVVDRRTRTAQTIKVRRFWTLAKAEDGWLITAMVEDLGDSALAVKPEESRIDEIVGILQREEQAWESGSVDAVAGLYAEEFIGYDGYGTIRPETWKIVFSDAEELERWLGKRLDRSTYQLDREVVFTRMGTSRREAVALTREKVSTAHEKGDVIHSTERYVLWTLSRRSGDWKITNLCYDLGLPD
jgi:hypothetical protein